MPRSNVFPAPPWNWLPRVRGHPDAPHQIIIFNAEQHFEAGFPRAVDPSARFPTPRVDNDHVEWMPWYVHNPTPIPAADMPIPLPLFSGVNNPATRATQTEIRYVQACRDYPGYFPVLPTQEVIDSWESQLEPRPHIPPPARKYPHAPTYLLDRHSSQFTLLLPFPLRPGKFGALTLTADFICTRNPFLSSRWAASCSSRCPLMACAQTGARYRTWTTGEATAGGTGEAAEEEGLG